MRKKATRVAALISAAVVFAGALAPPAGAEERELLGSYRDWDALVITRDSGERICYMISIPKDTAPKNVNRGNIYVTVTHRPKRKVRDEVNIVVGYPFRAGSEATVNIGGRRYTLFTEGQGAWAYTPDEDSRLVSAMKGGTTMVVHGTSSRGTDTTDRYSLIGFTAAYGAISEACS